MSQNSYDRHIMKHGHLNQLNQQRVNVSFISCRFFKLRMENHKCGVCNKAFKSKSVFSKHVCYVNIQDKVNYKKKNLECNVCKKMFMRRKKLNEHMKCVHQGLKKYVCPTCNRAFDKSCNLKAHINIVHLKLQPHKCDICGRNFSVNLHIYNMHIVR